MPRLIHIIGANRWREPWRHALDVCRHFRDAGWSVTAYTRDAQAIDTRFREAGIDLRHSPLRGMFDIYSAFQLAADLRRERKDTIIHVHRYRDAFAVLLARKLARRPDIRVVSTCHTMKRGAAHSIARRIYRNLDAQLFVSEAVFDRFLSTWNGGNYPFDMTRTHVVVPAVRVDMDAPPPEPDKGPKVVMCRAAMEPGNGLETLIDAIVALRGRKTRLWLVGQGDTDYIDTLRRRAQARGVMEMIDWKVRVNDVTPLIEQSHLSVDPSTTGVSFGPSHIETMAFGRPQILSSAISPPECVVAGRDVDIVPRGDAGALGKALTSLVTDADRRATLGNNAFKTYNEHLSWRLTAPLLEEIYRSLWL